MADTLALNASGAPAGVLKLSRGGWQTGQQGPGSIGTNSYYVENIFEELDVPGEWFLRGDGTLTLIPPSDGPSDPTGVELVAALHSRVIQLRGASPTEFAHDITLRGLRIKHSKPTFMDSYEMPSGGDWTIHRGGAVFLDGTEDVVIDSLIVEQPGGNGIFLSNHAWRTAVTNNVINGTGDSAIVLVGSTELMNGTRNTYPAFNNVTGNSAYNIGHYGKQVAAVFKSIAYRTLIERNVFFNSARSLVNYNDAFRGGDILRGNVLFGAVTETADHASFNSWDRQSYFWQIDGNFYVTPEVMEIKNNLILNKDFLFGSENSDWSIDHDDASSFYEDSLNVMVYGAHKWRDGVHKWYFDNMYVTPSDAGDNDKGVGWYSQHTASSKFYGNTLIDWAAAPQFHFCWSNPNPKSDFDLHANKYFTPGNTTLPFKAGGGPCGEAASLAEWQTITQNDAGSSISADMDVTRAVALAKVMLKY